MILVLAPRKKNGDYMTDMLHSLSVLIDSLCICMSKNHVVYLNFFLSGRETENISSHLEPNRLQ